MNTCLSTIYLNICKLDSRHIRLAFVLLSLLGFGGGIMILPIHGDVGG